MPSRRGFLAGLLASGLAPAGWASLGGPRFLSAGQDTEGRNFLFGLSALGDEVFRLPLPGRGHAAAAHPVLPQAVGFARRPGTFAFVLDCASGRVVAELQAPEGRHFYGHGVFSADGERLLTVENDYENAGGVIGIWEVAAGYRRVGEFASGGVGPHDIRLMPDGEALVVANGGIETHPESGRAKLNLPVMRPNLCYISENGDIREVVELPRALHMNSIRHLDVRGDGLVAVAMQWQGQGFDFPSVLALHRRDEGLRMLATEGLQGYGGSVAFSGDGTRVAVSSPRGGKVQIFDVETGDCTENVMLEDVCGLGAAGTGFIASTGLGAMVQLGGASRILSEVRWDNHLVRLPG